MRHVRRRGLPARRRHIEATVRKRLDDYDAITRRWCRTTRRKGLLHEIDGDRPVDVVFADVQAALEALAAP